MTLADAFVTAASERIHRSDISSWQKAQDVAEFQAYIRGRGQPHSTRDLARLLNLPQTRVTELLSIAAELHLGELKKFGLQPEDLRRVEHRTLLRIAKLPGYLRDKPLRDAIRPSVEANGRKSATSAPEQRRAYVFERLRTEGGFLLEIPQPIVELSPKEARTHLDDVLPALAHLANIAKGPGRSHYIGLSGDGGIVIYLAP